MKWWLCTELKRKIWGMSVTYLNLHIRVRLDVMEWPTDDNTCRYKAVLCSDVLDSPKRYLAPLFSKLLDYVSILTARPILAWPVLCIHYAPSYTNSSLGKTFTNFSLQQLPSSISWTKELHSLPSLSFLLSFPPLMAESKLFEHVFSYVLNKMNRY
jgi:hypothetical protein